MPDEIEDYAVRQEAIADEKEPDAPCSADMHRMQAKYARTHRRFPRSDGWPNFMEWCKSQWEND